MFVIVAGCGKLGSGLARVLSSQGHDVTIVGEDIDRRRLGGEFDGVVVEGNPIDEDILERAGMGKADLFVAATADDRLNAMAAQVAREIFRVPAALARISDPMLEAFYSGIGLDTVCPTSTAINQILDLILERSNTKLRGYIDPDIVGVHAPGEWIGHAMGEIESPDGRRWAGFIAEGRTFDFDPEHKIARQDVLLLRRSALARQEEPR